MYSLLRPLFFRFDPEWIHHRAMTALRQPAFLSLLDAMGGAKVEGPAVDLWGIRFPNPVGLAAGFDKDARALAAWETLGFGYAELGTVTPRPQPGNPLPRIVRLPQHKALINRMGFPNDGAEAIAARLQALKDAGRWPSIPIGINIGKQKETPNEEAVGDYLACFRALRPFADYFAINVSSPNTPNLRLLLAKESLHVIMSALKAENTGGLPIVVKIAPDMDEGQIADVIGCCLDNGIEGIVATNTALDRFGIATEETGGLSGAPLLGKSTDIVRFIAKETGGRLPILAAGGVFTADDVREKLDAGASLVQVYTGFVYQGPFIARDICRGLVAG